MRSVPSDAGGTACARNPDGVRPMRADLRGDRLGQVITLSISTEVFDLFNRRSQFLRKVDRGTREEFNQYQMLFLADTQGGPWTRSVLASHPGTAE